MDPAVAAQWARLVDESQLLRDTAIAKCLVFGWPGDDERGPRQSAVFGCARTAPGPRPRTTAGAVEGFRV